MAADPKAVSQTINYTDGALTMTIGAFESLFGTGNALLTATPTNVSVAVKAHSRTRVIGGASTSVGAYNYTYKQWPTSEANNAAGGDVVLLRWEGSDGDWTGRVTGSLSALGDFLNTNSTKAVSFRSERGTNYGPFKKGTP